MSRDEEFEIDLIDLVKYCWKNKRKFIFPMLIAGVLLVVFCIITIVMKPEKSLLPNKYTSTAKILVRETSGKNGISSSLASLASLGGVNLSSGANITNGVLITTIAGTNSYRDAIVDKFNLVERYKVKKNIKTNSRKALGKKLSVNLDEFGPQKAPIGAKTGDVVFYGHTHVFKAENIDGINYVNPGSISLPFNNNPRTYAVLEGKEIQIRQIEDNKTILTYNF